MPGTSPQAQLHYAEYLGFETSSNVKHGGPRKIDALDPLAVTNPAFIVEVLSRSTEEYDSGDKFEH
jgi:hypothetical protein